MKGNKFMKELSVDALIINLAGYEKCLKKLQLCVFPFLIFLQAYCFTFAEPYLPLPELCLWNVCRMRIGELVEKCMNVSVVLKILLLCINADRKVNVQSIGLCLNARKLIFIPCLLWKSYFQKNSKSWDRCYIFIHTKTHQTNSVKPGIKNDFPVSSKYRLT